MSRAIGAAEGAITATAATTATATAATTATAMRASASTWAGGALFGDVDAKLATVEVEAIETLDSGGRFFLGPVGEEGEASRLT